MSIFSSIASGLKKAGRAISGALGQIGGILSFLFHRFTGIFDFGLGLIGIRPRKKLHLRVVILKDENVSPLTTPNKVIPNINFAKSIFKQQANVDIVAVDGEFIEVFDYAAPSVALEIGCGTDAWTKDFGEAGDYFRLRSANIILRSQTGYGSPITAIIVREIDGGASRGCSLGPLANYVTVGLNGLEGSNSTDDVSLSSNPGKTLAHEIAHACGLLHREGSSNLMTPSSKSPTGIKLTRFQKAWLRTSRHITYF